MLLFPVEGKETATLADRGMMTVVLFPKTGRPDPGFQKRILRPVQSQITILSSTFQLPTDMRRGPQRLQVDPEREVRPTAITICHHPLALCAGVSDRRTPTYTLEPCIPCWTFESLLVLPSFQFLPPKNAAGAESACLRTQLRGPCCH